MPKISLSEPIAFIVFYVNETKTPKFDVKKICFCLKIICVFFHSVCIYSHDLNQRYQNKRKKIGTNCEYDQNNHWTKTESFQSQNDLIC